MTDKNETESAIDAGAGLARVQTDHGGVPFTCVPHGYELRSAEQFLPAPPRIKATPLFRDVGSFITYVKDFKTVNTRIFYKTEGEVVAVLDHHAPDAPSWCTHKATLSPCVNPRWQRWRDRDKKQFSQHDFAEFIEDNAADVVKPKGAEILELVTFLEAKTEVQFTSGVKLQNGNIQFRYVETTTAKSGEKGNIEIPSEIFLGLSPFDGVPEQEVCAKLRYRIESDRLTFSFKLMDVDKILEEAIASLREAIGNGTGITPLRGSP